MKRLKAVFSNDVAQGMLEYVLILAVILAIAALFRDNIKKAIDQYSGKVGGQIQNFDPNGGGGGGGG